MLYCGAVDEGILRKKIQSTVLIMKLLNVFFESLLLRKSAAQTSVPAAKTKAIAHWSGIGFALFCRCSSL